MSYWFSCTAILLLIHRLHAYVSLCPGVAGCCAKTTIAPLDRVKILLQAQNPHYKHLGNEKTKNKASVSNGGFHKLFLCSMLLHHRLVFSGVFSTLKAVPQKEGYLGLYKGNGAMMVRIFPYGAIQFMAFDNYKKVRFLLLSSATFTSLKVPIKPCTLFSLLHPSFIASK